MLWHASVILCIYLIIFIYSELFLHNVTFNIFYKDIVWSFWFILGFELNLIYFWVLFLYNGWAG